MSTYTGDTYDDVTTTYTLTVTNSAGQSVSATTTVTILNGYIDLTVTGTATFEILVSGPDGYTNTCTNSGRLSHLATGTYTLTPQTSWANNQIFTADPVITSVFQDMAGPTVSITYTESTTLTLQIPDASSPGNFVPMPFLKIPAGSFQMGSEDKHMDSLSCPDLGSSLLTLPVHSVSVPSLWIAQTPCTQGQWQALTGSNPSFWQPPQTTLDLTKPVETVSWDTVKATLAANTISNITLRLPTEAEWEYCCRAGTTTGWYFGDDASDLPDYAWYMDNSYTGGLSQTHPVAQLLPNPWGLYDMLGNVREVVEDDMQVPGGYTGAPADGSASIHTPRSTWRAGRGGDYNGRPCLCRCAQRSFIQPLDTSKQHGFRAVLSFTGEPGA